MATVVISAFNVASFPEGGGHFWVYLQYALGLRLLGCEVYWLEGFRTEGGGDREAVALATFRARMRRYGLGRNFILYPICCDEPALEAPGRYFNVERAEAESIFARADLLLNFHYAVSPALLARFRRTALVDIDPGLLQFWITRGQLSVPRHDFYFTIGETVGAPGALIPDCGLRWTHIRPPVCIERWPYVFNSQSDAFTTVSCWDSADWLLEHGTLYENTKRLAFLEFADLPRLTGQPLELALFLRTERDMLERRDLEKRGWRVRHSREVAATPEMYQAYIQGSRGEFSCSKRSCRRFQNAWISDRTISYLASGKPVVIQDTGPSSFLRNGEGMFRFSSIEDAVRAFETINADYRRHSRAAREIAECYFDSKEIAERILNSALGRRDGVNPGHPAVDDACATAVSARCLRQYPSTASLVPGSAPATRCGAPQDPGKNHSPQPLARPIPLVPIPDSETLVRILKPLLGRITITCRWLNPAASTSPSEIVRCRLADQRELSLFCKYGLKNSEREADHGGFGSRGGLLYEAQVYQHLLGCLTAPRLFGVHTDDATGQVWLILEYLDNFVYVSDPQVPEALCRAAHWLGRFHALWEGRTSEDPLRFLKKYDAAYYQGWVQRTAAVAGSLQERFPWLENLCGHSEGLLDPLFTSPATVIHGEYYPDNILMRDSTIYPVDWESTAIGAGEIDLASLTDGWPERLVQQCGIEYQRARWPAGAPREFSQRLEAARTYWSFRWLASRLEWTTHPKQQRRLLRLRREAERQALI